MARDVRFDLATAAFVLPSWREADLLRSGERNDTGYPVSIIPGCSVQRHQEAAGGSTVTLTADEAIADKGSHKGSTDMRSGEKPQHLVVSYARHHHIW